MSEQTACTQVWNPWCVCGCFPRSPGCWQISHIYIASCSLLVCTAKVPRLPKWVHRAFYASLALGVGWLAFLYMCQSAHTLQVRLCCQFLPDHSSGCFLAASRVHQRADTQRMQSADPDVYLGCWQRAGLVIWL